MGMLNEALLGETSYLEHSVAVAAPTPTIEAPPFKTLIVLNVVPDHDISKMECMGDKTITLEGKDISGIGYKDKRGTLFLVSKNGRFFKAFKSTRGFHFSEYSQMKSEPYCTKDINHYLSIGYKITYTTRDGKGNPYAIILAKFENEFERRMAIAATFHELTMIHFFKKEDLWNSFDGVNIPENL
jgi:hypothetical protein